VRRIDLPLISEIVGLDIAPVYIDFIASQPAAASPPIPVPAPNLSGGPPHVSYAVQWVVFSICAVVGWVFAIRRSLRTRKRVAAAAVSDSAGDHTDASIEVVSVDPGQPSA
jgi:surfeit locus 1 family protein